MHITTSAENLVKALEKWLDDIEGKRTAELVAGVPVDAYKERCAELRAFRTVRQELPNLLRKAKE